jgi:1,3-beta-glucanosyltransferase GAS3
MIIDVNSPQQSINRADPASSYTLDYLNRIFAVVEAFKGYPNTMGFFSANEVMNDLDTGKSNPPYIRVSFSACHYEQQELTARTGCATRS